MDGIRNNPWLGLKSYSEGMPFYGRDKEIAELSQKVVYNAQTVVYSRSGIGKSSLLKAGVFPILRRYDLFPVYIRLVHDKDDDVSYMQQIFDAVEAALAELLVEGPDGSYVKVQGCKKEIVAVSDKEKEGLWEYFHRHEFYYAPLVKDSSQDDTEQVKYVLPVLVFDQFEEIFTMQQDKRKIDSFFQELSMLVNDFRPDRLLHKKDVQGDDECFSVKELLESVNVSSDGAMQEYNDNQVHCVISLREDFLSQFECNTADMPVFRHNRYYLSPLNEEQAVDIIKCPVPGLVDDDVVKCIISKVTGYAEEQFEIDGNPEVEVNAAMLSIFLSELYRKKEENSEERFTRSMVERAGSNILADFYKSAISKVSERSAIFLEERLVTEEKRRDAIFVDEALHNGVSRTEIEILLEQRLLCSYTWRGAARLEFAHDILCSIIFDRRKERVIKKKKAQNRRIVFVLVISFLAAVLVGVGIYRKSMEDAAKKEQEMMEVRNRNNAMMAQKYKNYIENEKDTSEIYINVVERETWYEGVGNPIPEEEAGKYPAYYRLYKKGTKAKHPYKLVFEYKTDISNALDSSNKPDVNNGTMYAFLYDEVHKLYEDYSNFLVNSKIIDDPYDVTNDLILKIDSLKFVPDAENKYCVKVDAYSNGKLKYSYVKNVSSDGSGYVLSKIDTAGMFISDTAFNKIKFDKIELNDHHYIKERAFVDVNDELNEDTLYRIQKILYRYDDDGNILGLDFMDNKGVLKKNLYGVACTRIVELGDSVMYVISGSENRTATFVERTCKDKYGRVTGLSVWKAKIPDVHVDSLRLLIAHGKDSLEKVLYSDLPKYDASPLFIDFHSVVLNDDKDSQGVVVKDANDKTVYGLWMISYESLRVDYGLEYFVPLCQSEFDEKMIESISYVVKCLEKVGVSSFSMEVGNDDSLNFVLKDSNDEAVIKGNVHNKETMQIDCNIECLKNCVLLMLSSESVSLSKDEKELIGDLVKQLENAGASSGSIEVGNDDSLNFVLKDSNGKVVFEMNISANGTKQIDCNIECLKNCVLLMLSSESVSLRKEEKELIGDLVKQIENAGASSGSLEINNDRSFNIVLKDSNGKVVFEMNISANGTKQIDCNIECLKNCVLLMLSSESVSLRKAEKGLIGDLVKQLENAGASSGSLEINNDRSFNIVLKDSNGKIVLEFRN